MTLRWPILLLLALALRPAAAQLDEPPQPLVVERARDEDDLLRLEALSRFATGRKAEQQDEYAEALRWYQRALRSDPESAATLERIVVLAASLGRGEEALRYAVKGLDLGLSDPLVLRQLAVRATEQGDFEQALRLYEQARDSDPGSRRTALGVMTAAEMGRLYLITDRHPQAAEALALVEEAIDHPERFRLEEPFRKRLLRDPRGSYELFGRAYLEAGRYDEALLAFRRVAAASPDLATSLLWPEAGTRNPQTISAVLAAHSQLLGYQAKVLHRQGRESDALAALEQSLRGPEPPGGESYELLARVLGTLGRSSELMPRLAELRKRWPKSGPLLSFMADQARAAGDRNQAETLYREALAAQPSSEVFQALAELIYQRRDAEALLLLCGEVVDQSGGLSPLSQQTQTIAGDDAFLAALIDRARAWQQQRNEGLTPGMALGVALLALEGGRLEAAGEYFELAMAEPPTSREQKQRQAAIRQAWAFGLLRAERWNEAAEVVQKIFDQKLAPTTDEGPYRLLAYALDSAGRTDEALRILEPRVRRSAELGLLYAEILNSAGRTDEAAERFQAILKRADSRHDDPSLRDALRRARMQLSNLAVGQGQMDQAEEWLEQVLDEFPDDVGAANDLGYLWADANKRLGQALEMARRAVAAEPENAAYRDTLGWALFRLGRYGEAAAELDKARSLLKEPDGVVLDHLGDARFALGNVEAAREAWRQAAEALAKAPPRDALAKTRLASVEEKLRRHDAAIGQATSAAEPQKQSAPSKKSDS